MKSSVLALHQVFRRHSNPLMHETFSIDTTQNSSFWIRFFPAGSEPVPLELVYAV